MRERVSGAAKQGYKRSRRGFVIFITSDKIIQAILTGAVTGFVFSLNEAIAAYIQRGLDSATPFYVPVKLYAALLSLVIVVVFYWADRNTEEWRSWVRDTTGEETAEDTASEQDVAGDTK